MGLRWHVLYLQCMFENVSRNGALFNQHRIIKLQTFSNKSCFEWVKYVWKMHTQLCTKDTHFTSIRRHIQWQNVKLLNYWPHVHQCIAIGIAIKLYVTPSVHSTHTHTPWKRESLRDYNLRLVRDSRKKWQKFISLRLINVLLPRWFRALSENVRWKKLLIEWCHQRTKICPHSETE